MTQTTSAIDPAFFREALGHYPTGVAVVTGIAANGSPLALVVGSFTSLSLDPPLVAFCPMRESTTFERLRTSPYFCVNVLASDQEELCRRLAAKGTDRFAGVSWTEAPGGSPVLDGVVSWVECALENVLEGGDHYIVIGRVRDLAVARSCLPLLFFQGGYGRFSLPSLLAATAPDFAEAVRLAELIRDDVEACAFEQGADCTVFTKVNGEIVTVLSSHAGPADRASGVGTRRPHLAPLGAVLAAEESETDVERWLAQMRRVGPEAVATAREKLARVRERGYSISLQSDATHERLASLAEYNSGDPTPQHDRRIRQLITESLDQYEPDLVSGRRYDVYSVAVPVRTPEGAPSLMLRLGNLPPSVDLRELTTWVQSLRFTADEASARLGG